MRLLCYLHLSPVTVQFLRHLGHDAIRATERLPATAADEEILELARTDGRVLVTQDLDFGALLAASGARAPSVVTLRLALPHVEAVNRVLAATLSAAETALTQGAIVSAEDQRVRIRPLPIDVEA